MVNCQRTGLQQLSILPCYELSFLFDGKNSPSLDNIPALVLKMLLCTSFKNRFQNTFAQLPHDFPPFSHQQSREKTINMTSSRKHRKNVVTKGLCTWWSVTSGSSKSKLFFYGLPPKFFHFIRRFQTYHIISYSLSFQQIISSEQQRSVFGLTLFLLHISGQFQPLRRPVQYYYAFNSILHYSIQFLSQP